MSTTKSRPRATARAATPPAAAPGPEAPRGEVARGEMRLISRAAAILRAIADHPTGLSLGQIAKETGLSRATVQRLVDALEVEGLLAKSDLVPGVRLGVEIARIAASVHRDVALLVRPILERLNAEVGETVDLTMLQGGSALVVDQVQPARALRVVSHIGTPLPLHCTASGKAHLSQMSGQEASSHLVHPLTRYTDKTITSHQELLAAVANPADDCFVDDEEFASGVCALALPVRGLVSGNYVLSVSLPKQRFDDSCGTVADALRRCRDAVERMAGTGPAGHRPAK